MYGENTLYPLHGELLAIHITHFPHLRFFQFLETFKIWVEIEYGIDGIFYIEDKTLLKYVRAYSEYLKSIKSGEQYDRYFQR